MTMNPFFKVAGALAIVAPLGACGVEEINSESSNPDLRGEVAAGEVWTGAPPSNIRTIQASALSAGKHYKSSGRLIIEGNIPDAVQLTVTGEVLVNGDVGNNVRINVIQPIAQHSVRTRGTGYCMGFDGKFGMNVNCRKTDNFNDGLIYDDSDPAIEVNGAVQPSAKFDSYGAIEINGDVIKERIHLKSSGISLEM